MLSIVIKCLNEEAHIGACLESALAATRGIDAEIVVADAYSSDRTIDIARQFPVRIVRMADPADRGRGATAQMGRQFARGQFLLLVDGDMEVLPDFLPAALAAMDADPGLAGIGGRLIEISGAMEFQERTRRDHRPAGDRTVRRLSGSALYRMSAILAAGHFMDRNLLCGEELDLGQRLRALGWRLKTIELDAIRHHGHEDAAVVLLSKRWRDRYFDGYGQLLRRAWRQPYFWEPLRVCALFLAVAGWWGALAVAIGAAALGWAAPAIPIAILLLPVAAIAVKKRRLGLGFYTFLLWQVHAAAFLRGLARRRKSPAEPVLAVVIA